MDTLESLKVDTRAAAAATLIGLLRLRAQTQADKELYSWLAEGESLEKRLTCGELDKRARVIAAALISSRLSGQRALLLYSPGLEYIEAFFGCLYAGVIAVPAGAPRSKRDLPRLKSMAQDSGATVILGAGNRERATRGLLTAEFWQTLGWIDTDSIQFSGAEDDDLPTLTKDDIAYLQYTSGSTAVPKGVIVTHGNLMSNLQSIAASGGFTADTCTLSWLPHFHDMGLIYGFLQPIFSSFSAILFPPSAFIQKPYRWLEAISRYRVTHTGAPNFAYDLCVQRVAPETRANLDLSCWKVAFNGAEPVRAETIESFTEAFSPYGFRRSAFYPVYGLAEATLKVTSPEPLEGPTLFHVDAAALEQHRAEAADLEQDDFRTLVSSGKAGLDTEIAIVHPESGKRCDSGEVGEIWVHGHGVSAGYWNRPEESAETFYAIMADDLERTWLRTGDLGFVQEGQLFITGRRKDCIIIRGQNHYPQDIERTVERAHPALMSNASIAFSISTDKEELLVIAAELKRHYDESPEAIGREIRKCVSEEHELQAHVVVLLPPGHLPRTSSGKVRRQDCKQSFLTGSLPTVHESVVAKEEFAKAKQISAEALPKTVHKRAELESWLASTVAALLKIPVEQVDLDYSLTAFGLDSLAVVQLSHQLQTEMGFRMEPGAALGGASIRTLVTDLISVSAEEERPGAADSGAVTQIPLSMDQKALWLIQQRASHSGMLNVARAVRLDSSVDAARLRDCLQAIVQRHPGLHGHIVDADGEPRMKVGDAVAAARAAMTEIDATKWDEDRVRHDVIEQSQRPFLLHEAPLFRVCLYQLHDGDFLFLMVVHHIVADFWSLSILVAELAALYGGKHLSPPPSSEYFHKRLAEERRILSGPEGEQLWEYWRNQLHGELESPLIPADRPRLEQSEREGEFHLFEIPSSLTASLQEFARTRRSTLYTVLLTGFEILLHRYTGQSDFVVGTPAHGRNSAALGQAVGYFVRALPLRADLRGAASFEELHERVVQTVSGALAHDGMPFSTLSERLGAVRPSGGSSLMDVSFVMQRSQLPGQEALELVALGHPGAVARVGTLEMQAYLIERIATTFETVVTVAESGGRIYGSALYDRAIFDRATIDQFIRHFVVILEAAMTAPEKPISELSLLSDSERLQLVVNCNRTEQEIPPVCVHELFEARTRTAPDNVALVFGDQQLTYGDLNARANQLAHYLRAYGVGPEVPVAICCEPSLELVVAILAILKAGGMYVPLDASYPAERLAWMMDDSQAPILLTERKVLQTMPSHWAQVILLDGDRDQIAAESTENPEPLTGPENSAYIIYTSGSTGKPKGVVVEHRNVVRLVTGITFCTATAEDTYLLFAPVTFDASTVEIWAPLANGSRLVIAPAGTRSLEDTAALVEQSGITVMFVTSGLFHQLVETQLKRLHGLRYLMTGGDIVSPHHARLVAQNLPGCVLVHAYGPTENTAYTTCCRIESDPGPVGFLPLGGPISNTTVFILDEQMQPVPAGVPGELYTGGLGVARGYLHHPELTAQAFVPDPFSSKPGGRLYRTGDRVRWTADGKLHFLGRRDHQVKLRGFRIELEEIQAALMQFSGVKQALALVREDTPDDKRLVAYVAAEPGSPSANAAKLREHLSSRLPEYMVPGAIVVLQDLPLTTTGKVDRKSLPVPDYGSQSSRKAAPRTPVEEILVGIWSDVLKVEHVGTNDIFFDLGGHSLLATQLISRARAAFGIELPFRALFESPTVSRLAERVEEILRQDKKADVPAIVRVSREAPLPLSFAQQRLWFLEQLDPGSTAYNSPGAVRLTGKLDVLAVQRTLSEIARRHEILRTTFPLRDGEPVQQIAPAGVVNMPLVDLSETDDREQRALQLAREEASRPFDLSRGPLLRTSLVRLEPELHLLLFTVHHSVCDAWSVNILTREFTAIYKAFLHGERCPLPELPIQYADFACWQRQWLSGNVLEKYLSYWRQKLAALPPLHLRIGNGSSEIRAGQGQNASFDLSPTITDALKEISRREGSTLFMTMLAAFEILMLRYSGQTDFAIGAPVAGRNQVESEDLVGFFVNMLPLRVDLSGDPTFEELLERVRTTTLEAHSYQALPLEKLIEEVKPPRINGRPQIFQVTFALQNDYAALNLLPGGESTLLEMDEDTVRFGLVLWIFPTVTGFRTCWRYHGGVFEAREIEQLNQSYCEILDAIVQSSGARVSELAGPIAVSAAAQPISDRTEAESHAGRIGFSTKKRNAVRLP